MLGGSQERDVLTSDVVVKGEAGLRIVCLNRPATPNAISLAMWRKLKSVFDALDRDGLRSVQRTLALVGLVNAKRMLFSAERYDAARSNKLGLVDEIVADAVSAVVAFARTVTSNAPLSIAGAKVMLNGLSMGTGALDVATAQRLIDEASDGEDFKEGRRAFAEKRLPQFTGR
jgi:enoyl-CoA hydratase/carnithine racemase